MMARQRHHGKGSAEKSRTAKEETGRVEVVSKKRPASTICNVSEEQPKRETEPDYRSHTGRASKQSAAGSIPTSKHPLGWARSEEG
jgi:hypothetical protein